MKSISRTAGMRALVFVVFIAAVLCFVRLDENSRGFYIDESSIGYNAWTIASKGCDEHGVPWPLYFQAFGDYKNPVYIYLLAGLFRLAGPGIYVARAFSATAVVLAAIVLGFLAMQLTRSRVAALLISTSALLTPWLFELAHVAVEVALYPLVLALFLFALHRAAGKMKWSSLDVVSLTVTLALI